MRPCVPFVLSALALGCASTVPVRDYVYACEVSSDCAAGWSCTGGVCAQGAFEGQDAPAADADAATTSEDAADVPPAGAPDALDVADAPDILDAGPVDAVDVSDVAEAGSVQCKLGDSDCLKTCAGTSCLTASGACYLDAECKKVLECYLTCADLPCRGTCIANAPQGTKTKLATLQSCLEKNCL